MKLLPLHLVKITSAMLAAAVLLQGCATPTVVQANKPNDIHLSCAQLKAELEEAYSFEKKARDDRKVNGKNVAAAMLFWPALLATYNNTEEAIVAAKERQNSLTKIYQKKGCR